MFPLYSTYRRLGVWSLNHTSIHQNSAFKLFKNIKFLDEISDNWSNNLLRRNGYENLGSCW